MTPERKSRSSRQGRDAKNVKDRTLKKAPVERPAITRKLLDGVAGGQVARVERLAAGETFILAMIKTNAILAELPAKINFFIADDRRKIEQANVKILDDAAGFQDAVERGLQRFGE